MTSTSLWAKLINSAPTKNNKLTVLSPVCKVHTHPSLTEVQGGSGKEHRSPLKECGSAADAPGALPPRQRPPRQRPCAPRHLKEEAGALLLPINERPSSLPPSTAPLLSASELLPPLPWAASLLEEEMASSKSIRQHKELFSF